MTEIRDETFIIRWGRGRGVCLLLLLSGGGGPVHFCMIQNFVRTSQFY